MEIFTISDNLKFFWHSLETSSFVFFIFVCDLFLARDEPKPENIAKIKRLDIHKDTQVLSAYNIFWNKIFIKNKKAINYKGTTIV